jgi:hypothetical protein
MPRLLIDAIIADPHHSNSMERDEAGWRALLNQADPRLEMRKMTRIPGNILVVMEVGLSQGYAN